MTMGVEMVAMSRRTNATKKRIVNGVAGLNILQTYIAPPRVGDSRC